jgi:two-component system, chemotaxis family, chemotaxis protein CheY
MSFNVLVVDDSAVMRAMIIRTLRLTGVPLGAIHEAGNGEEGLAQVREHWIDFALLDINMPIMNGEEMLDRLRADPDTSELPIIVVSTESSDTRLERIRARGAAFVHKPFTPERLRDAILTITGVTDADLRAESDDRAARAVALAGGDLDF